MTSLTILVFGWRGFLVGNRRTWHAHHRWAVQGVRGGILLASPPRQVSRFSELAGLVSDVFSRGGRAWFFGGTPREYPWGTARRGWRPGVLTNYFFARTRKTHFVRHLLRSVRPGRVHRRRVDPSVNPSGNRVAPGWPPGLSGFGGGSSSARPLPVSYVNAPQVGRARQRYLRGWWAKVEGLIPATPPPGGSPRVARRPGGSPFVSTRAHSGWPVDFPAVTLGGDPTLLGSTVLNEARSAGVPLVRFLDAGAAPAGLDLLWNPAGSGGVPPFLSVLFERSSRAGLLRVHWRRLAER